ncbi:MAG: DUF4286 family protein [Muribaculaceae bacterium]|nr:DUF4286 family protein [Muribaculaceae bacterium]
MFSYNVTFVVEPSKESELLDYINNELRPKLFNEESPARNPQLKKVVEAGGEKPDADHGLSIALSADFQSEEEAHLWNDHILIPALGDFHSHFGQYALFFVTLLEILY